MSKKNLRNEAAGIDNFVKKFIPEWKPSTSEDFRIICNRILSNVDDGKCCGDTFINFAKGNQFRLSEGWPINGGSVIKFKGVADSNESDWIYIKENEKLNAEVYIGFEGTYDGIRAFWLWMLEDGTEQIFELDSIFVASIIHEPDWDDNDACGCVTYFKDGKLFINSRIGDAGLEEVKSFISEVASEICDNTPSTGEKSDNITGDVEDTYIQNAPLLQEESDPALTSNYDSLNESEYLDAAFNDMKDLFNKCDFASRKNEPTKFHATCVEGHNNGCHNGCMAVPLNTVYWPVTPSQYYNIDKDTKMCIGTKTVFNVPNHFMAARYEGSFHIKKAVIRARFTGDDVCHTFYIGEHDQLSATVLIGYNSDNSLLALMIDGRIPQYILADKEKLWDQALREGMAIKHDVSELEEFTMLAVTDGRYYKNYMKPRAVNDDLAIFTCYNKNRKVLCDTVASFTNGLCDPDTIFTDTGAEDVRAF